MRHLRDRNDSVILGILSTLHKTRDPAWFVRHSLRHSETGTRGSCAAHHDPRAPSRPRDQVLRVMPSVRHHRRKGSDWVGALFLSSLDQSLN